MRKETRQKISESVKLSRIRGFHGRLLPGARADSIAPRFWSYVEKTLFCWLWKGRLHYKGYGEFSLNSKSEKAHRFAYKLVKGPIPPGMTLDHLCRNRACVNPDHLEIVSNRTNILRGEGVCAKHFRKTHCLRGHPFTERKTRYGIKTVDARAEFVTVST